MTRAERTLLLAVFRWARAEGGLEWGRWAHRWARQTGPREQWLGVDYDPADGEYLSIYRGRGNAKEYWVSNAAEAVDVLVALGILPHRFSTSYRAGYEATRWADGIAASPATPGDWNGPRRGWSDPAVYALLPAADRELAVRGAREAE